MATKRDRRRDEYHDSVHVGGRLDRNLRPWWPQAAGPRRVCPRAGRGHGGVRGFKQGAVVLRTGEQRRISGLRKRPSGRADADRGCVLVEVVQRNDRQYDLALANIEMKAEADTSRVVALPTPLASSLSRWT